MKPRINLKKKTVYLGERKYWYKVDDDRISSSSEESKDRVWYRYSKTYGYLVEDDGWRSDKMTVEESEKFVDEERQGQPADWEFAKTRVKSADKIEKLNRLVDKAQAEKRKQDDEAEQRENAQAKLRQQERKRNNSASDSSSDERQEQNRRRSDATAESSRGTQERAMTDTSRQQFSLSFALKSAVSDYVLNIRVARSKKQKGLYNFSIHLGSKFLGYVEVPLERVMKLGRRLARLGKTTAHVKD